MSFTLASRVSALGSAELVQFVYVPAQTKTYFIYTIKTTEGGSQFYAKALPPLVELTPSAAPTIGSEIMLTDLLPRVGSFSILSLQTAGHVIVVYDDYDSVWKFIYDFITQTVVSPISFVCKGTKPQIFLSTSGELFLTYLKDSEIKSRISFGTEAVLVAPSATTIVDYSAVPLNSAVLNYAGAHTSSRKASVPFSADGNTILAYILDELPPTVPYYEDQNLTVGAVSFGPIIQSLDPEGKAVTYTSINPLPAGLSLDPATGIVSGDLTAIDLSKGAFKVSVSDGLYNITSDTAWLFGEYATGGQRAIYNDGSIKYKTHSFYNSETFDVNESLLVDYLIVGGGGGGGMDMGGGGGGGGVATGSQVLLPGSYQIKVGAGGGGAPAANDYRTDGAGPQPSGHQYTIPATNGKPSSIFGTNYDDAFLSLLLNMNGANDSTTFTDLSPYKNSISVFGNAKISTVQSKFGGSSAFFDGNGDYLSTIPNVMTFGTEDFTVEAWIRLNSMPTSDAWPTNYSSHMVIVTVGTPSAADGFGFIVGATKLILQSNDSSPQLLSGTHGMIINTWYHVAATRSGNIFRLFVDGINIATTTSSIYLGTGSATYIGGETGQGAWFNGYMNDLRVTRGLARYTQAFAPPTSQFAYNGGVVAIGGGAGGSSYYNYSPGARGYDGASGGGASGYSAGGTLPGGRGISGQGFSGGQGGGQYYSGGGGGAGGAGTSSTARPNGGPGVLNAILGTPYYWAGGGGGAAYTLDNGGDGGIGGGGGGAVGTTTGGAGLNPGQPGGGGAKTSLANTPGGDGGINTGGGGGGGSHYNESNKGGDGGSGIIVLRHKLPPVPEVRGGTESTFTNATATYKVHTFTASLFVNGQASFNMAVLGSYEFDYLIVGGGGGGGANIGGGGGAGGVLTGTTSLSNNNFTITIGQGGTGSSSGSVAGTSGYSSSFNGLTAIGGGGGASRDGGSVAAVGGSGGGGAGATGGGRNVGAVGTAGQGSAGGNGTSDLGANSGGGGGGGAGAVGGAGASQQGGAGGNGILSTITGTPTYYGGGGGGGTYYATGAGGLGGGGASTVSGTASTGGGGGGGGNTGNGGNGGSGLVIVRYKTAGVSVPVYANQDLTAGPVSFGPTTPSVDYQGLPLTYSTTAPLPSALSIDPTTGVISGNLAAPYTSSIIVSVTNGTFTTLSAQFFICVAPSKPVYTTQNLSVGAVSFGPTTPSTGPNPTLITYSTVNPLPSSLSINPSTGVISGNLAAVGVNDPVVVQVTNGTYTVPSDPFYLFGAPYSISGGTETTYSEGGNTYKVLTFMTSGTLTVGGATVSNPLLVDYLVVAGGGGGGYGNYHGAGGGAGGLLTSIGGTKMSLVAGSYPVVVGNGGASASNGQNSTFNGLTAIGGGAGGRQSVNGSVGGSGGGSGYGASGAAGTASQGNAGANGQVYLSGGGGGAGAAATGGNGGNGLQVNINGTATYYAGGGGGSNYAAAPGVGGLGGGGNGANGAGSPNTPTNGTANTGGGGGGGERGGSSPNGGTGGSGIVVIRYLAEGVTAPVYANQNLSPGSVSFGPTVAAGTGLGQTVTYSTLNPLPAGLSINSTTGVISGTLSAISFDPVVVVAAVGVFTASSNAFYLYGVVTSGRVLGLDAGNPSSYSGSGTTWTDLSGTGNNGTLVNGVAYSSSNSGYLSFDGTNDYVSVPYSSSLAPTAAITYESFAYLANWGITSSARVLSKTQAGGYSLTLNDSFGTGFIGGYIYAGGAYRDLKVATSTLAAGWHHFAFTFDGRYMKMYVDGVNVGTYDHGSNTTIGYSTNNHLLIGAEPGTGTGVDGSYWPGRIATANVYSRALSAAEVQHNFNVLRSRFGL